MANDRLQKWALTAEVIGGIAIVISLLFVGYEVRENSKIVNSARLHDLSVNLQAELRWSSEIAEIQVKASEDPGSLTTVEAFKMGEWLIAAMLARQNEYFQYKKGMLDEEIWHQTRGITRFIVSEPFNRRWWKTFDKSTFTPEYVAFVDGLLDEDYDFSYNKQLRELIKDN